MADDTTPDLGIPEVVESQADVHETHNEAVLLLQTFAKGVVSLGDNSPPGSPVEGDAYVVGTSPNGAWSNFANRVVVYYNSAWLPIPGYDDSPTTLITLGARQEGMRFFVNDEQAWYIFRQDDGSSPLTYSWQKDFEFADAANLAKLSTLWETFDVTLASGVLALGSRTGDYGNLTFDGNDITSVTGLTAGEVSTFVAQDAGVIEFDAGVVETQTGDDLVVSAGDVLKFYPIGTDQVRVEQVRADGQPVSRESGTWTAGLTFVTPGDLSVTYSINRSSYVLDGDQLTYDFLLVTSTFTHTTASGNLRLTGVPASPVDALIGGTLFLTGITHSTSEDISSQVLNPNPGGVTQMEYMSKNTSTGVCSAVLYTVAEAVTGSSLVVSGTASYPLV